jgi:hypothetical protein
MWVKKGNIFNEHHAQVPVVDIINKNYRVYYSTKNNEGKSIPMVLEFSENMEIVSTPKKVNIDLGKPGYFDWSGIMPTKIITLPNGIKYLYYIGWSQRIDVPYHNCIGLALSKDNGTTWEKFSDGPIFNTSHMEPGFIGSLDILIENKIWKMWYLSCRKWIEHDDKKEPVYDIKYAYSTNGIDWIPTNHTCINLHTGEGGIATPRITKNVDGTYKMIFCVRGLTDYRTNEKNSYRIESAISNNGLEWDRNGIVLSPSPESDWDNIMVSYPYLVENNKKRIIFYNGNGFGKTGIGYAIYENTITK